jgi:hypothetical protein
MAVQTNLCHPKQGIASNTALFPNTLNLGLAEMREDVKAGSKNLNQLRPSTLLSNQIWAALTLVQGEIHDKHGNVNNKEEEESHELANPDHEFHSGLEAGILDF